MDKDFDPLRELETEDSKDDSLQPTVHLNRSANKNSRVEGTPASSHSQIPAAVPVQNRTYGSPSSYSNLPTVSSLSASTMRMRVSALPNVGITEHLSTKMQLPTVRRVGTFAALFSAGLLLAFAFVMTLHMTSQIKPDTSSAGSPTLSQDATGVPFIEPLFSKSAKEACFKSCSSKAPQKADSCRDVCNMYSLELYARRITFEPYDPIFDSNEILTRCLKKPLLIASSNEPKLELSHLPRSLALISATPKLLNSKSLESLAATYRKLVRANDALHYRPVTPELAETAKLLTRTTCLQANMALTAFAITKMNLSGDRFSARYYEKLYQDLLVKSQASVQSALNQAKSLSNIEVQK